MGVTVESPKHDMTLVAALAGLFGATPPAGFTSLEPKKGYSKGQFLRSRERVFWPATAGTYRRGMEHGRE